MKDKELRKLLEEKGIIDTYSTGNLVQRPNFGLHAKEVDELREKVSELNCGFERHSDNDSKLFQSNSELRGKLKTLEAKFDAINEHYGITVEHEDAKYVVKEDK